MSKKTFTIVAEVTTYTNLKVQAENSKKAYDIAMESDPNYFIPDASEIGEFNIQHPCDTPDGVVFYAGAIPKEWDNIEIEAVRYVNDKDIERCEYSEADFYSVYLHDVNGGVQCIADCETKQDASDLYILLKAVVNNYKETGHLNT